MQPWHNYQAPDQLFAQKVALVTGAGAGIGAELSIQLARLGATVILLGRTQSKLEAVYDEIVGNGYPEPAIFPCDLNELDEAQAKGIAEAIHEQLGQLDILVHNASVLGQKTPLEQYNLSAYDQVMQINCKAPLVLTQALLPLLNESTAGRLLFTSSSVGRQGRAFWGAYSISKFATESMMQIFAAELDRVTNIAVHAVNPGATRTNMRAQAMPGEHPESVTPASDIMPTYLYLLGPEGSALHGQSIDAQTPKTASK
ncbi:YciK family oxidoreductase [Salinibius halmophilus]|uniref:YciK family oxidoreductase n=1 Tax=Salinibius halmophilus TaxID=1853216 RepID=UPI000E668132|nr:YciK family oxidoreductase [Salinibius halmophilus]